MKKIQLLSTTLFFLFIFTFVAVSMDKKVFPKEVKSVPVDTPVRAYPVDTKPVIVIVSEEEEGFGYSCYCGCFFVEKRVLRNLI